MLERFVSWFRQNMLRSTDTWPDTDRRFRQPLPRTATEEQRENLHMAAEHIKDQLMKEDDLVVEPGHPLHDMLMDAINSQEGVIYGRNKTTGKLEKKS